MQMQTQIVEVSVYPDRARVTRRGTVTLETGAQRIEIDELPLALDPSSVRAGGTLRVTPGSERGEARLLGVDVQKKYYDETPAAQAKDLEDQIQALEDQDKLLSDKAESLKAQAGLARSVAEKAGEQLARGVAFARTDMGQGDALMRFVAQELTRTQDEMRQVSVQRRELGKQLEKLCSQLKLLQGSRGRERYTATIEVEVMAPGQLTLDLIYTVANSGWEPLYDIRLNGTLLELTYLGQVTQRTGEDWNDVSLVLSTARPSLAAVLPELEPWYLSVYQPQAARYRADNFAPQPAAAPMALGAVEEAEPVELQAVAASVESAGASVTFRLAQKATLPADGQPHKVTVAIARLDSRLDYVSAPKLAEAAFRRATVKNASELMLLPGQASLFIEGDFIGATTLKQIAPGEEFEFHLGVDDRVFVKRELKARDVDKKFLQDKRQLHYGYEIEVRNLRGEKIALELRDQLPVSRHESVKVKLDSTDPKPAETSELGELTWKLSLEPDAVRFVRFDFSVEHPRDVHVAGLP